MKNKSLVIIIIGLAVVALTVVLLTPVALAYGSQNGYGLGFNQLIGASGSRMGQGQGMMQDGAMMRGGRGQGQGQGQGQGMMQDGAMMRGGGQGQGMMQDGAMMHGGRGQGQGQGMMQDGAMMHGGGQGQGMGNNGAGLGLGAPEASMMTVVAEQLGLEQADLVAELQSGQTMAEVITAHGVELNTVVDAFLAPRADQLAEKVANEDITQAQADSYLAMMKAKVTEQLNSPWSAGQGHGPGNGSGTCDHAGQGQGGNFVDEDSDGVCDHAGTGSGQQMGGGRWQ
ncbi:MAG: hypothetical protein H6632_02750 [Anaerolineales bacterium]|nr:hypothetical protein [Anaerolineales bacterium]